jgi:hypothetical protein
MMKIRSIHAPCVGAVLISLAACGGPAATTGIIPGGVGFSSARSWMTAGASNRDLVYVGNADGAYVLSYPGGQLEGTLGPLPSVVRLCSDARGHIFLLSGLQPPENIYEYAHGGSQPIKTLNDAYGNPWGCAVDPSTGNLAVTNLQGVSHGPGNLLVYQHASGKPHVYNATNLVQFLFCGYDNHGNLFADGTGIPQLVELSNGGTSLTNIAVNRTFGDPLSVQWDGQHITVADFQTHAVYRVKVEGSTGIVVGKTTLRGWSSSAANIGSWIQGNALLAPTSHKSYKLGIWNYPQGGKRITLWTFGDRNHLNSVTISHAPITH